ncbi:MAG: GFA family protein [Hyphomonadaceae bacterium]
MSDTITGGCLCGAVRYECAADPMMTGHCHCVDCRKTSGTGHGTHVFFPRPAVTITGTLTAYDRATDSGNTVTRGFCPTCGSAIYSANSSMTDAMVIRASSLDDPEVAKPQMVVYASRAPSWDLVDPDLPAFAEMPDASPQEIIESDG